MEWSDRWLDFVYTRENLMQTSAAKYIFVRKSHPSPSFNSGLKVIKNNSYGKLLELQQDVCRAVHVTPILMDVEESGEVNEFFNILLPGGYKMVFVDIKDIRLDMIEHFDHVMLDKEQKIENYPGKTVFLLNNANNLSVTESNGIINLNLPYISYTDRLFYHGDKADGSKWYIMDNQRSLRMTISQHRTTINASELLEPYLSKLDYSPAAYLMTDNKIKLQTTPGFTLVKDSYFPYWKTDQGSIMTTSQGFMLIKSDKCDLTLIYQEPIYYATAAGATMSGLAAFILLLPVGYLVRPLIRRVPGYLNRRRKRRDLSIE